MQVMSIVFGLSVWYICLDTVLFSALRNSDGELDSERRWSRAARRPSPALPCVGRTDSMRFYTVLVAAVVSCTL